MYLINYLETRGWMCGWVKSELLKKGGRKRRRKEHREESRMVRQRKVVENRKDFNSILNQ